MIHLTEPFTKTELYLIGTTNYSNILANRTKKLIREIKPDTVFVQTNERWWKGAQFLQHVKSQEEMQLAQKDLHRAFDLHTPFNFKSFFFNLRFSAFALSAKYWFGLPLNYNPFLPGLEVKYACEEAEKLNSKIVFMGYELNQYAWDRFYHDNRYSILKGIWNSFNQVSEVYANEWIEHQQQLHTYGLKKYIESSCDQYFINWCIQMLAKIFPDAKRILIEKKEEELFQTIMDNKGKVFICFKINYIENGLRS
jgi:pheromone shutdown protein TraB